MFLRKKIGKSTTDCWKEIEKLEKQIQQADAIIIGAVSYTHLTLPTIA